MFEKFSVFDVDSAGEVENTPSRFVLSGVMLSCSKLFSFSGRFGWTNGLVLWVATTMDQSLMPAVPQFIGYSPEKSSTRPQVKSGLWMLAAIAAGAALF